MDDRLSEILIASLSQVSFKAIGLLLLIFLLFVILTLLKQIPRYLYIKKIKDSGIQEVDQMSGWEFEKFLEGLFQKRGYQVEHVGNRRGDYGGDLVLEKDGIRILVQAKRYSKKVDIKAIQEVVAAKRKYNCQRTMVVTNSYLTQPAWDLGVANHVTMWTRKKLIEEILRNKGRN